MIHVDKDMGWDVECLAMTQYQTLFLNHVVSCVSFRRRRNYDIHILLELALIVLLPFLSLIM